MSSEGGALPAGLRARYQVLSRLGVGAFGEVLRARDLDLQRDVALKLSRASLDPVLLTRFGREAALLASIRHPGIVEAYDGGTCDGVAYLAMELLEGVSLEEQVPADPLAAMLQVGEALDAVHAAGLVHRDLKPANILAAPGGRFVLVDFGLVLDSSRTRFTETGAVVGTLGYMAPELLSGRDPSPSSDWYAWGVTLYWLLEQRLPFLPKALHEIAIGGSLTPPTFSVLDRDSPVARLLLVLLTGDEESRPSSSEAVARQLKEGTSSRSDLPSLSGVPSPLRGMASAPPPPGRGRRAGLLSGLAALAMVLGVATWWPSVAPSSPGTPATGDVRDEDSSESIVALRASLERLTRGHRGDDGEVRPCVRNGSLLEHLPESAAALADARIASLWRRTLEALADVLSETTPEAAGALVVSDVLPAVHHLVRDEVAVGNCQKNPRFYGSVAGGEDGAWVPEEISQRSDELAAVRREGAALLVTAAPSFCETPAGVALRAQLSTSRPAGERALFAAPLLAALERARDPWLRAWLAITLEVPIPGLAQASDGLSCQLREELVSRMVRFHREEGPGLPDRLRAMVAAEAMMSHHEQLQSCRPSLQAGDLAQLDHLLDSLEADLDAAPGAAARGLEMVSSSHRSSGGFLLDFGPAFEARVERLHTLADLSRGEAFRGDAKPGGLMEAADLLR